MSDVTIEEGQGSGGDVSFLAGDFPVAFAQDGGVVVNFGVLTGREATLAEIDRLARSLRQAGAGPEITITAARRQHYSDGVESVWHQVHVATSGNAPGVEEVCRAWAVECADDRSVEPLA